MRGALSSASPSNTLASVRKGPITLSGMAAVSYTHLDVYKRQVSLAQQVEQRETLAIQYTIELRRMLNEVPVQEGVRQFLFHVWADVLATTAVRFTSHSEQTKQMKRAAADLIWSASAKVTREERAEVIRRLPLLLKSCLLYTSSQGLP